MLLHGDCLIQLKTLPDNSVDSIVTDPPYGLSFMGKKWDYDVPTTEIWAECLRVLKPGGHLLAFFGTRTYHRGVVRIEDAGFEIRDQIMWIYGSGFPKSHDVSKGIDKQAGAEREVLGTKDGGPNIKGNNFNNDDGTRNIQNITAPSTDAAKQWAGWGTALKPANEPIVVARKPLEKGLTIAENVMKWGTGALNIDASRIGSETLVRSRNSIGNKETLSGGKQEGYFVSETQGRWPANVLFDEQAAELLDAQSGTLRSRDGKSGKKNGNGSIFGGGNSGERVVYEAALGGASRFFYVAKASKRERGTENVHPTVKPIKLMEYLITLVTPPNGSVLDPFMGSGSTGVAAKNLSRKFIGIELSEEYFEIAQRRIV